jgi:Arc/MetJ-type ribon-helix-helix transcriptional regulator
VPRHLDPADLPENVARYAQAQVAAGRFASIEAVLSAGVEALQQREQDEQAWLEYARKEAAEGFAELERGEGISGTVDQHMARIDAAVRARIAERLPG